MKTLEAIAAELFASSDPKQVFATMLVRAPSPVMVIAASGDLVFVNQAFERLFREVPPPGWNVFEDPICCEQGMPAMLRRALTGETVRVPPHWFRPRTPQPEVRIGTEIVVHPLPGADGGVAHVLAVYRDVTAELRVTEEHARAEAALVELRAAHEALLSTERDRAVLEEARRLSEERLRLALRASQAVAWEIDFRTNALTVSEGAEEMGMDPRLSDQERIELVHPADRQAVHDQIVAALVGIEAPSIAYRVAARPGGEYRWLEPRAVLVRDAAGSVVGSAGITFDVTARKRAEQLELENARILQANRAKTELLASMSHELRTPLNSIIGFAELLHDGAVDPGAPEHQEFLADILRSARHLLELINDVLDLTKVEAGKLELRPEPIDVAAIVDEVRAVMHPLSSKKRIPIDAQVDPALDEIILDPWRLKQVLYNYLSNAIKFTAEGGRVTVRVLPEGEARLRIEVEDTGIGIAEDDVSKLFRDYQQIEPLARSDSHAQRVIAPVLGAVARGGRRPSGTGLGLALTRRLVEAQGGSVGAKSAPGVGSVFFAVLPRKLVVPPSSSRRSAAPISPRSSLLTPT